MEHDDHLPISALAHLIYCERRAALVHVVGAWSDNEHTTAGHLVHERVDSGEESRSRGLHTMRSVHVRSDRLRLAGIIDLVDVHQDADRRRFVPVETKRGARKRWLRDEVQLCAQAMALEEMTGASIELGAIFHAASQRRRPVRLDDTLRRVTEQAATRLHALFANAEVPPPRADERCPSCSLHGACQPSAVLPPGSLASHLQLALR